MDTEFEGHFYTEDWVDFWLVETLPIFVWWVIPWEYRTISKLLGVFSELFHKKLPFFWTYFWVTQKHMSQQIFLTILLNLFWLVKPFIANFTKWSNILKQFVDNLAANSLSVFDHFVRLRLKGLKYIEFKNLNCFKI